jgi:integrase
MHSLRHSFASALISGGAAVTEVQMLLGHSSPAVTLKVYSHWFKSQDSGAVARLSDLIMKSEKSGQKVDKHADQGPTRSANTA